MKIKALKSFCGTVTMTMNEVKEVDDKMAENLIAVNYAVAVPEDKADKKKKSDKNEAESNKS